MGAWRRFLRVLGLTNDARVQITAPGIEVTLIGEPSEVTALLGVVRGELERRRTRRIARRAATVHPVSESQVVRPTELDEMDSPYALPEAVMGSLEDEEELPTDERELSRRDSAFSAHAVEARPARAISTQDVVLDDEPEPEATAVTPHPHHPQTEPALDERVTPPAEAGPANPFAPDVRPTLLATDAREGEQDG